MKWQVLLLAAAAMPAAYAQTRPAAVYPASALDLHHTIQPGDNLYRLAGQYLASAAQWPVLRDSNTLRTPHLLQPGQVIRIPAAALPAQPVAAAVTFIQGKVRQSGTSDASPSLSKGSALTEGTQLQVAPDGFISIQLADGSVIKLQANTVLTLERMRRRPGNGATALDLQLHQGSIESVVAPQPPAGRSFHVRTRRAVASVRGTEFTVVTSDGADAATSVSHGAVAVQPPASGRQVRPTVELQAGEGNHVDAQGRLGAPRKLASPPDLAALSQLLQTAQQLAFSLPAPGTANTYQVRIAHDESLTQVVRNGAFTANTIQFPALPEGAYFMGVRAVDTQGILGLEARRPVDIETLPPPPFYQSPAPGQQTSANSAVLRCTGVANIQWFHIQLARTPDFLHPEVDGQRLSTCELTPPALLPGTWYWRAASVKETRQGAFVSGPFAAPQSFVATPPPPTPTLGAGAQTSWIFWDAKPGYTYRIQVATDPSFLGLVTDKVITDAAWSLENLPAGRYHVRIQSISESGLAAEFSEARQVDTRSFVKATDGTAVLAADHLPVGRD